MLKNKDGRLELLYFNAYYKTTAIKALIDRGERTHK